MSQTLTFQGPIRTATIRTELQIAVTAVDQDATFVQPRRGGPIVMVTSGFPGGITVDGIVKDRCGDVLDPLWVQRFYESNPSEVVLESGQVIRPTTHGWAAIGERMSQGSTLEQAAAYIAGGPRIFGGGR